MNKFCPIYLCDYPILRQMENLSNTAKLEELKEYFRVFIGEIGKQHYDFHPEFLGYKHFLDVRLRFTVEAIRQACLTNKTLCVVTNYKYVDKIIDNWRKLGIKPKGLNEFYPLIRKNDTDLLAKGILKATPEESLYNEKFILDPDPMSFVDFIEKMVIIDFFFENFVGDNFISNQSFPFSGKHTTAWMSGFCNLFHLWDHYMKEYKKQVSEFSIHDKEYRKYFNQFNYIDDEHGKEDLNQEELDNQTKKFEDELNTPGTQEIYEKLKSQKPLEVDNIIPKNSPFKNIKKKK